MASSISADPWLTARERYLETLTDEEKHLFTNASLENVFYTASAAQKNFEETDRSRALFKKLKPFLDVINDYGAALDVYSNTSSMIMCPLWGSIRVLLHVELSLPARESIASEFDKYFEKLIDMFASIGDVLPTFRVYQQLFAGHYFLLQALSEVYLDIIEFCMGAKQVFDKVKQKRGLVALHIRILWKPFDRQFGEIMAKFYRHKSSVDRQAHLSHMIEEAGERGEQSDERMLAKLHRGAESAMQKELRRIRVLKHLSSINHERRHRQLRKKWFENTGGWIFSTTQFMEWIGNAKSCCLWCHGIPGSGKTIITTTVVEALLGDSLLKAPVPVVYFYCDYSDKKTLDASEVLGSFIKQLLSKIEISDDIRSMILTTYQHGTTKPDADDLLKILFFVLEQFSEVFLILDGVDECGGNDRTELLMAIQSILGSDTRTTTLKLFIASRPDVDLKRTFNSYITLPISVDNTTADIIPFINGIVREKVKSQELLVRDPSLVGEIIEALVNGAQGMFIWVTFQIADICEETCDDGIRKALQSLPEDLAATYTRALLKIHKKNASLSLAQKVFKWMVCATRPLSMDEIKEAISISPLDKHLERSKITTDDSGILKACANLAVVDVDEDTIRFAHYSVKEFLLSTPADSISSIHFQYSDAAYEVAEICVTYLSFNAFGMQISKQTAQEKIDLSSLASPFLLRESYFEWVGKMLFNSWAYFRGHKASQLVSINWDKFLKPTRVPPAQSFQKQFRLLDYVIENWASHTITLTDSNRKLWSKFRLLTFEKELGFTFRPWGQSGTVKDLPYMSLVYWAIQEGHGAFLKLLLEPPKGPSLPHYFAQEVEEEGDRIPLLILGLRLSVRKGHDKVVRMLLEIGHQQRYANINPDSLFDIAVQNKHSAVIWLLLLESGVSKSARDRVLLEMAWSGHDAIVKLLLDYGADGDTLYRALLEAARGDHYAISKLLLENGADGARALLKAAQGGHGAAVKLLLKCEVDGTKALVEAARDGNNAAGKILLECETNGAKALFEAARGGHNAAVKILLECEVDGTKALVKAARDGHDAVVKLLLECGVDGTKALFEAARGGHNAAVKILLEYGVDGTKALVEAARDGHDAAVKLLLKCGVNKTKTLLKVAMGHLYESSERDFDTTTKGWFWPDSSL